MYIIPLEKLVDCQCEELVAVQTLKCWFLFACIQLKLPAHLQDPLFAIIRIPGIKIYKIKKFQT